MGQLTQITGLGLWEQKGTLVTQHGGRRTRLNLKLYSASRVTQCFARALRQIRPPPLLAHPVYFGILQVEIWHIFKVILLGVLPSDCFLHASCLIPSDIS